MVQAQQVQYRGVQVIDVHAVFNGIITQFVGLADRLAGVDSAASHPHRKGFDMMITTDGITRFTLWSTPKLTAPNDQGVFEQTTPLEILN